MKTIHRVEAGDIEAGAVIVDANGDEWQVRERRANLPQLAFLIVRGASATWIVKHVADEVALLDTTAGQGVENVMAALGGVVVIEPLPLGPDKPVVRAMYRAHLHHHHGLSVPLQESQAKDAKGSLEQNLDELIRLHAVSHASPEDHLVKHVHQPIGG